MPDLLRAVFAARRKPMPVRWRRAARAGGHGKSRPGWRTLWQRNPVLRTQSVWCRHSFVGRSLQSRAGILAGHGHKSMARVAFDRFGIFP